MSVVRVGSRKSELALVQTNKVIDLLKFHYPEKIFEVVTYDTLGDKFNSLPLPKIGEKSLFTKELELALQRREVDLVVHSLKDLPSSLPKNLRIGAICKRDDPHDCVLYHPKFGSNVTPTSLNSLPNNSTVGSSSIRRISQLKQLYPQLIFLDIRGNVNTRLKKLCECDKYDAIILAKAGVDRMGWQDRIGQILNGDEFFYAVGQGALAVEIRSGMVN
jgi:hydroxymethylbilane synthase